MAKTTFAEHWSVRTRTVRRVLADRGRPLYRWQVEKMLAYKLILLLARLVGGEDPPGMEWVSTGPRLRFFVGCRRGWRAEVPGAEQ